MISVAEQVRSTSLSKRNSFVSTGDFEGVGSHASVRQALSRLARDNELIPVREGLYWRGTKTKFGMRRPNALQIAEAIVGKHGVGYAGVSAANPLGLTSQVPGVIEIAVPTRAPQSLNHLRFVGRAARSERRSSRLNAMEVALLEVLNAWEETVEESYERALHKFHALFADETLNVSRLARAADGESARTRTRLSQLLKDLEYEAEAASIRGASVSADRYLIAA